MKGKFKMATGFTQQGTAELDRHELIFWGLDRTGARIPDCVLRTADLGLVPTAPLVIAPFDAAASMEDVPNWHGQMEHGITYGNYTSYKNATGSWTFYYVHDGANCSPWDLCSAEGCVGGSTIANEYGQGSQTNKAKENYPGEYVRPWTFSGAMRRLMVMLQGKRVEVAMPDMHTYKGRCWVSKFDPDDKGKMQVTISYDLAPPAKYQ